jgi:hypothetical protein
MSQKSGAAHRPADQGFTEKQGQYLAFIYTYSHMFRRPPAEADLQRHFQVSPPSVHQMIVTLERKRPHSPSTRCSPKHRGPRAAAAPANPAMAANQPLKITVKSY